MTRESILMLLVIMAASTAPAMAQDAPAFKNEEIEQLVAPIALRNRRIVRNELSTVQAMLAYVDAQREYYARNPQNAPLLQYAQRFVSSPGKRDGLYFPTKDGEPASPLRPIFDSAKAEGYKPAGGKPQLYHGYHYRILNAQGPNAPGGAYGYIANGAMVGGFALVAWPATYRNSGVMTFVVNHDRIVYGRDLGPATAGAVSRMTRFDPSKGWNKVSDQ